MPLRPNELQTLKLYRFFFFVLAIIVIFDL